MLFFVFNIHLCIWILLKLQKEYAYTKLAFNLASYFSASDHIDHVKNLVGVDYVGIGADYDGVPE